MIDEIEQDIEWLRTESFGNLGDRARRVADNLEKLLTVFEALQRCGEIRPSPPTPRRIDALLDLSEAIQNLTDNPPQHARNLDK